MTRGRTLDPEHTKLVVRWYARKRSIKKTAEHLRCSQGMVRRHLRDAGVEVQPRGRPRVYTPEEAAERERAAARRRYATDSKFRERKKSYVSTPEYRERKNRYRREWRAIDDDYAERGREAKRTPAARAVRNARHRARYASDPAYRDKCIAAASFQSQLRGLSLHCYRCNTYTDGLAYCPDCGEEINARNRDRYANDPEYRERTLARKRTGCPQGRPMSSSTQKATGRTIQSPAVPRP